jgi:hypothetical protein
MSTVTYLKNLKKFKTQKDKFKFFYLLGNQTRGLQKFLRKYSLTKAAARSHYLDVPPQTPRYNPLSMQSLAMLH